MDLHYLFTHLKETHPKEYGIIFDLLIKHTPLLEVVDVDDYAPCITLNEGFICLWHCDEDISADIFEFSNPEEIFFILQYLISNDNTIYVFERTLSTPLTGFENN